MKKPKEVEEIKQDNPLPEPAPRSVVDPIPVDPFRNPPAKPGWPLNPELAEKPEVTFPDPPVWEPLHMPRSDTPSAPPEGVSTAHAATMIDLHRAEERIASVVKIADALEVALAMLVDRHIVHFSDHEQHEIQRVRLSWSRFKALIEGPG